MELILWRHADAECGEVDLERPLSAKGQQQARQMAAELLPRLPANVQILVSPALRTRQTADALGRQYYIEPALAPDATVEAVLRVAGWPQRAGCVLIIGHQPTLGWVASTLLTQSGTGMRFRKGAVWWIEDRGLADGACATLRWAMSPA